MQNIQGKYIKDENRNVISPITSTESIFYPNGINLNSNLGEVNGWMNNMKYNLFKPGDMKNMSGNLQPGEHFQTTIGGTGFIVVRCYASYMEQCRIYAYATSNKYSHLDVQILAKDYIDGGKCDFMFIDGDGEDTYKWFYIRNIGTTRVEYQLYQLNLCP